MVKLIQKFLNVSVAAMQPKGVVLHNTADGGTALTHMNRLHGYNENQLAAGFTHYFCDRNNIVQLMSTDRGAWSSGNTWANYNLISYEVCESTGDVNNFLANEEAAFMQMAKDMERYGLTPNRNTVHIHKEYLATACPHRSIERHGDNTQIRDYAIERIKHYMNAGTDQIEVPKQPAVPSTPPSQSETGNRVAEQGVFAPDRDINIRVAPNTAAEVHGTYGPGESVVYDSFVVSEGYVWVSWIAYDGDRHYMVCREQGQKAWGNFDGVGSSPKPQPVKPAGNGRVAESGVFKPNTTINVRTAPYVAAKKVAEYGPGESVNYDSYVVSEGYVWISYVSNDGNRRYMVCREQGKNAWGELN